MQVLDGSSDARAGGDVDSDIHKSHLGTAEGRQQHHLSTESTFSVICRLRKKFGKSMPKFNSFSSTPSRSVEVVLRYQKTNSGVRHSATLRDHSLSNVGCKLFVCISSPRLPHWTSCFTDAIYSGRNKNT